MQHDQDGSKALPTMLRVGEVSREVGVSERTIYRKVRDGDFPAPVRIGKNSVAWHSAEVVAWLRERPRVVEPDGGCILATAAHPLYPVNMSRARHPKKDVEAALALAEAAGWRVMPSSSGHRWGVMYCGAEGRAACKASIWSTPRNPGDHAKQLRRRIGNCPHTV